MSLSFNPLAPFIFFTLSKYLINMSIFQFIVEFSLSGYFLSSLGSTDCVIFVVEYSDISFKFEVEHSNWASRRPTARWSLLFSYVSLVNYIVSCQVWRVQPTCLSRVFGMPVLRFWRPIYIFYHIFILKFMTKSISLYHIFILKFMIKSISLYQQT